jgi:endonuclease/exonuclease/phosphatase family metal-dependent hydrolase
VVYGPQSDADKLLFLQELRDLAAPDRERWLVVGDFNLIYQAADKNNTNLNRRLMGSFKATIDALHLKEIRLNGRRFTWSNGQDNPTLTRIDRFFCTPEWELLFPSCYLHSLPSTMSDHTPLLLQGDLDRAPSNFFRFENFWIEMEGFNQMVQTAWNRPVSASQPLKRLHIKMARTAKAIKQWKKTKIGDTALQLAIVNELILQLETAQEDRPLSLAELDLLRRLKARSVGLALIEKSRIRQRSRLTYIRLGDANTKFFQLRANARSRKNYIQCLQRGNDLLFTQQDKEKEVTEHFKQHLGSTTSRLSTFNWSSLGYQ